MTTPEIVSQILMLPEIADMSRRRLANDGKVVYEPVPLTTKQQAVERFLPMVVRATARKHPFSFLVSETTFTGGTTASTADYELQGEASDAADILIIQYGDNEVPLTYKNYNDLLVLKTQVSVDEVKYWSIKNKSVSGYPVVTITATPTTTGEQIKYRYLRNDYNVQMWDDDFIAALICGVASFLVPKAVRDYHREWADRLASIMEDEASEKSPGDQIPQDPSYVAQMIELNSLGKFGQA